MRHLSVPGVLAALCFTVAVVPAAPSAGDPTAARVAALIGQLGSPDYRAREAASRELVALGEPALEAAREAAATSEDLEVARRAADAAERIATDVDAARTLAPALVELSADHKPLLEVLADVRKQTGYKVGVAGPSTGGIPVTVTTGGKVPFWEAIDRLCAAARVHVVANPAQLRVGVTYPGDPKAVAPALANPVQDLVAEIDAVQKQRMEIQARVLAAAKARTAAKTDEEKAKAAEAVAARNAEMAKVLRQLVELQSRQQVSAMTAARPAAEPMPIVLRPLADAPAPASRPGAVRVEVVPYPAAGLANLPAGVIPVLLQATPEPRLRLERVESVRVARAVDDAGRDLKSLPSADATTGPAVPLPVAVNGARVIVGPNGRMEFIPDVAGKPLSVFPFTPAQAVVRLKAADAPPKSLKHLEGAIRAVVRTGPQELAAVTGPDPARGGVAATNGVGLSVTAMTPTGADGEFALDVTAGYSPTAVQPDGGIAAGASETVFAQNGGRVVVRRQFGGRVALNGRVVETYGSGGSAGVHVLGADGKPLAATVTHRERRVAPGAVTDILKLTVKGRPAKVSFTGTRAKVVEVPFKLADVAVATGVGDPSPSPPAPQ